MTAKDLALEEKELVALISLLGLLEREELPHVKYHTLNKDNPINRNTFGFNMAVWSSATDCGTVCCLGGSAEIIGGFRQKHFCYTRNVELHELFYPPIGGYTRWKLITTEQAATALRNYLTTGKASWSEII